MFSITLKIFGKVILRAEYRKSPPDFNEFISMLENVNISFPKVDRKSKQKKSKHGDALKTTNNQHYLFDICKILCKISILFLGAYLQR